MTIPMVVMLVSGLFWLVLSTAARPKSQEPDQWVEFHAWLIDVCRILFGVSALVVIYGLINKVAF